MLRYSLRYRCVYKVDYMSANDGYCKHGGWGVGEGGDVFHKEQMIVFMHYSILNVSGPDTM